MDHSSKPCGRESDPARCLPGYLGQGGPMIFSTTLLAQALVSGTLIGGVFALIAVGLTLIWGVMRIINFAHGEFLMVGLYIGYFLVSELGMQPYVAGLIVVPALFLFGALLFKATLERTLSHPTFNTLLLTLGLSLVLQNTALALFSATPRA